MTRIGIYSGAFVLFLGATAATLYSILADNWLVLHFGSFEKINGLHHSWSSTTNQWTKYPTGEDCRNMEGHFCQMWRTMGFLMNIAAVLELATVIAYLVIIIGGRQKREYGWKVLVALLLLVGILQCSAMSIVSYIFDYDSQFSIPGWHWGWGYTWCIFSWCICILLAAGIAVSAYLLPSEGGYELIPSERSGY